MAELEHSRRNIERATYTPIRPPRVVPAEPGRALDKWGYFATLAPTAQEMAIVARRLTTGEHPVPPEDRPHLEAMQAAVAERPESPSASVPLEMMRRFATIPAGLLRLVGEELLRVREEAANQTVNSHAAILARYEEAVRRSSGARPDSRPVVPEGYKVDPDLVVPGVPGAKVYRFERKPTTLAPTTPREAAGRVRPAADATGQTGSSGALVVRRAEPAEPASNPATTPIAVGTLMEWAIAHDIERPLAEQTLTLARRLSPGGAAMTLAQYRTAALVAVTRTKEVNYYFNQHIHIEPVGLLHLERLSFVPSGIERGELIYSVPLTPGEEVNITHKEWSNTSEEFERIVTDYIEAFSEEGVTEKSELAQATTSQR